MKRKIYCCSVMLLAGLLLLVGCGNEIPELSEEERSMVVNYAADIVQKYDSNHPTKLQVITFLPDESEPETEYEENTPEGDFPEKLEDNSNSAKEDFSESKDEKVEVIDNTAENAELTLDQAIRINGFHFEYEGCETDESYPSSGTESYFAMNATEGNELLVLKFSASNQSGAEEILDMLGSGIRFRIQVNGETKNALTTMLLNDFANYKEAIAAGESTDLVVICEISKEQTGNISSLALIVKNEGETATISLH